MQTPLNGSPQPPRACLGQNNSVECLGYPLSPSPPTKKSTACEDQTWQSCSGDGSWHSCRGEIVGNKRLGEVHCSCARSVESLQEERCSASPGNSPQVVDVTYTVAQVEGEGQWPSLKI
jgi:hypothetical protein